MTAAQLDIFDAISARDAVLDAIASDPRNGPSVRAVANVIADRVRPGEVFSANDIRPFLPVIVVPHTIGPVFGMLRRKGAIEMVGQVVSTDRGTHGKPVAQYRLATP